MLHLTPDCFLDRLLIHPQGCIVACNIVDGLEEHLFDETFVRELLDWWRQLFLWHIRRMYLGKLPKSKEQDELMGTLNALLFEVQAPGFRPSEHKPDFRFVCKRKPRVTRGIAEFVNITTASVLIEHLMDEDDRRKLAGGGKIIAKEIRAFIIKGVHQVRLKSKTTVGRPKGVLWYTPADGLQKEFRKTDPADCVRDRLGLIHYNPRTAGGDEALVALHLPGKVITTGLHSRPTFADAGGHARFKTRADNQRNRRRSTWGYTADLAKFADDKRNIDGLPERVAEPAPSARLGIITVTPLNPIVEMRGETPKDNHDAFADRLCEYHGGKAAIRDRLRRL